MLRAEERGDVNVRIGKHEVDDVVEVMIDRGGVADQADALAPQRAGGEKPSEPRVTTAHYGCWIRRFGRIPRSLGHQRMTRIRGFTSQCPLDRAAGGRSCCRGVGGGWRSVRESPAWVVSGFADYADSLLIR